MFWCVRRAFSLGAAILLLVVFFCSFSWFADAYDPVDPNGNITINWDFQNIDSYYTVMVSIHNYQLYHHIEPPGWRLGWRWSGNEVIWDATGAEATEQGDCSRVPGGSARPHCCERSPVMVDLPPATPYNKQVANCCRGGVLSSLTQDGRNAAAAFQMYVGGFAKDNSSVPVMPTNFNIGVPGYTCSAAAQVPATRSTVDGNRHVQALLTWRITCSYSQFREAASPSCCVSLSTFYNSTIVSCPHCSCGCPRSPSAAQCVSAGDASNVLKLPAAAADGRATTADEPIVRCTDHMCPIRVHWHVKTSYRAYWRVKVTVTNYNVVKNYSDWNLVVQHPNLRSLTQLFSFNYQPLVQYGTINDTGMFWGINNYNEMLLQDGNVQTEMILRKDKGDFTFSRGWAFPRKVYFDGHQCVMPPADQYPLLPNTGSDVRLSALRQRLLLAGSCLMSLSVLFFIL